MPTFLVTTATGRQGASTARILLAQGHKIHALVRDSTSPASLDLQSVGAILFKGDFADVAAINAALQGVDGVFLNTVPNLQDPNSEIRATETFVAAARATGTVNSFVVSTVFRTDEQEDWSKLKDDGFPFISAYYSSKAGVERVIRASGFAYTILRPGWLMHNYIGSATKYHFPGYRTERVMTVSVPRDHKLDHFDAADVGKFAAAALLEPGRYRGKEIDLVNEWLTFEEVARHLSDAIGAEVKVRYRTPEETAEAKKKSPSVEKQAYAADGYEKSRPDVSGITAGYGFPLSTFKEFLKRETSEIRKTVGIDA
ncbi:NmrA domain-containing protein [Favolaschia claudopus]|uniref:NmrA domain-containing protein n=1 Tax=Favolaschia claudopus TaxID=2862362 RepID=A0AAW0D0K3_9AGAR